tara:strand:+ start:58 stop:1746 length:1689 start_codon:yes stop_codon:yes gene_type:complete
MIGKNFIKIFGILNKSEKFFVFILFLLAIFCSILEFLSISAILPLLQEFVGGFENSKILNNFDKFLEIKNLDNYNRFLILIFILIFIFFIKNITFVINTYLSNYFAFQMRYRLLNELYEQYLKKDYQFFLNKNSNELIRNRDTVSAIGLGALIYLQIFNNFLLALSLIFAFILFIEIELVYTLVLFVSFLFSYYLFFKNKIEKISKKEQKNAFHEIKNFQQTFKGIKEILTSGKIIKFLTKYDDVTKKQKYMNITLSTIPEISRYFIEILTVTVLCGAILYVNYNTNNISLVLGSLSIIFIISLRLFPILNKILQLFQKLNVLHGKLKIFFEEFKTSKKLSRGKKKVFIKNFKKIELKNINFKYNKNLKKNIINNLNLTIKKKQVLGISGKSGRGKSTLIDIILGLLKIDSGKILIDGQNKKNYVISCNYISQFDYLFDDSIINNISIFSSKNKINVKKIKSLLSIVELDKLINQLPNKLDTQVGEYGKNFSGGQMQRISLIRSMYEESDLIVFDEPTNMLDKKSSIQIFKRIMDFLKNKKTIIIISHDKKILNFCDKVINL